MSNSSRRKQTPAQRAAAQRRAVPTAARPAPTVLSNQADSITLEGPALEASYVDDYVFDLDAVAHEAEGERFRFKIRDGEGPARVFHLRTPEEVDWRENSTLTERAVGAEDLRPVLKLLVVEYEDFLKLSVSIMQVNALMEQWREWHGVDLPE